MAAFIGIDLGTTFSAVATLDDTGRPSIVHNSDGRNLTPSCVAENDGTIVVGEFARRTYGNTPDKAAARFKREMGSGRIWRVGQHEFSPTELSTFVLKKLLQDTTAAIGAIGQAVVTIPANFANEAREATMAAAKAAGLDVQFIINEPTAAALYYAFKSGEELHGNYAVYDLGGGTFDVSIIRVEGQNVDVLASNGVTKLGGDDFDEALISIVARKYKEATGEEMDRQDFSKNDAEQEKISLSQRQRTTIRVARHLIEINRADLEEAISSRVTQAEMLCEATLDEAGIQAGDIRTVFLAGGSTRIPLVKESIKRVFGQEPVSTVNVDEVVALGAALYAAYRGDQSKLSPVQKKAIQKIKVAESTTKCFGTLSMTYDSARGQPRLVNAILINKGDRIPCSVTKSFYTIHDGQVEVDCSITESTAPETDPKFVRVVWQGMLDLPANRPKEQEIRVTYSYDENQIMSCNFVDVSSGLEKAIDLSMSAADSINDSEIDKFLVE
jgi:molecular chaperone DnaK